jgi:hypothetical protein
MQQKNSSKIRYVKIQSASDRSQSSDTLSSFTIDLTETSFLQNCVAAQLVSCGFTHLSPNVDEFSNTLILQTNDVEFQVPILPDMKILIIKGGSGVQISIPSPPAGTYANASSWALAAANSISEGIANAGSFDLRVEIIVDQRDPTRFSWDLVADFPPSRAEVRFDPTDEVAKYLGITPSRFVILGKGLQSYPGPLLTFPDEVFVGTFHTFTVPANQYSIDTLMTELNSLEAPFPTLIDPAFSFVNDRVEISTALAYPRFRVVSLIDNSQSSLAPLLGLHGYTPVDRFFVTQVADTPPGLVGLTFAYVHIQPSDRKWLFYPHRGVESPKEHS